METSTSPPKGKPRAFDYLLCPGSGEFDLCLRGVGKIEPEVSNDFINYYYYFFFFLGGGGGGAKSLIAIKHMFGRVGRG